MAAGTDIMSRCNKKLRATRRCHLLTALSLATSTATGYATEYAIQPLGLTDPAHTLADGTYASNISLTNSQGDIAGTSMGIPGSNKEMDAWFYNHATRSISLISLPNSILPSDLGSYGTSTVGFMNSSGDVVGATSGENQTTFTATWYYDSSTDTTNRIGLTDSTHTDPNTSGYQLSNVTLLNSNGQAAGTSNRYSLITNPGDQSAAGTDSWFYDKHTNITLQIGLTGGSFTGGSNQTSAVTAMNGSGATLGYSYQYTGTTRSNQTTAWIYDPSSNSTNQLTLPPSVIIPAAYPNISPTVHIGPAVPNESPINDEGDMSITATGPASGNTTQSLAYLYNPTTGYVHQIGLTSAGYQSANGTFNSVPYFLTATGNVVGDSTLYSGSAQIGTNSWYFDKSTGATIPIGPSASGSNDNFPVSITPSGQQVVVSDGNLYWEYNNVTQTTTQLGFTGGIYNDLLGFSSTHFHRLNARGQVTGYSPMYSGNGIIIGFQAWFFDPSTTASIPIGLFDPVDTEPQGLPRNAPAIFNDNGMVVGTSTRYANKIPSGKDGWYYDPNSNTTTPIRLSADPNGYANLTFKSLSPNGIALGTYLKFDGSTLLGQFAFLFDPATGPIQLDLNVANLSDNGWKFLQSATAALSTGQILGTGHLTNDANASNLTAFLLSPVAPGDADLDGDVDLSDLSTVLNNFGAATTSWTNGNFDGAATIDLTDLSDVLNNFGASSASAAPTPTPEPATLALLLPVVWSSAFRRRRTPMRSEA